MKYNVKFIEPAMMFLFWLLCFAIICIVGISNVFADTYENIGYLNNNSDVSVEVSYTGSPLPLSISNTYQLEDVKALNINISNYIFTNDRTYSIELSTPNTVLQYANVYTVVGLTRNDQSVNCSVYDISYTDIHYPNFRFKCNTDIIELNIRIFNTNGNYIINNGLFSWNYVFLRQFKIDDNTQDIINNQNQNTQDIINNQNQNNEELKDTINDNFNSCRDSYNLLYTPYTVDNKLTDTAIKDDYFKALNYYATLQAGKTYTFSVETDGEFGSGIDDTVEVLLLKGPNYTTFITMRSNPFTFIPQESGDYYIRYDINQNGKTHSFWNFQIVEGSSSKKWEQAGVEICTNKIDETNDKLDGIQGAITDSTPPNTSGLENSAGWLPPGPLDSILNLPLTMLNSLTNSLGKTCSPLILTLPYVNKNIEIPCLSSIFAQITGVNSLWTWVGTIASVLILYNYLLNLYAWVDRVLTLRAEFDEAMGADLANWGRL